MASGKRGNHIRIAASTLGRPGLDNPNINDPKTAIVGQACADYLSVLRGKKHHAHMQLESQEELETFFRSTWFKRLCDCDGDKLIIQLRHRLSRGQKFIHYGRYSQNFQE